MLSISQALNQILVLACSLRGSIDPSLAIPCAILSGDIGFTSELEGMRSPVLWHKYWTSHGTASGTYWDPGNMFSNSAAADPQTRLWTAYHCAMWYVLWLAGDILMYTKLKGPWRLAFKPS